MSFYGNMTSQLSQAFSRFLFRNSGRDKQEFQEAQDDILDATHSSASVTFDSGNRWIQIDGGDDGCKIWHSSPVEDENDLTLVSGFTKVEDSSQLEHITQLNSGDCLQVPLLFYDKAGHVSTTGEAVAYKLPVIAIESDIETVKKQMEEVQTTVTNQNSNISKISTKVETANNTIDAVKESLGDVTHVTGNTIDDMSSAIGDVSTLKKVFGGSESKDYLSVVEALKVLKDTCDRQADQIATLNKLVNALHPDAES